MDGVREETAMYSSDSYLACLSFLSMAEQRVFIDNTKSFSQLLNLRISFRGCSCNKGVPVPFKPSIPVHPSLCFRTFPAMYANTQI